MALPASGPLSIQQINAEFGRGNDLNSYRGTTWYTDAGGSGTFSTGALSMSDFYGKRATSPLFSATIYSHYDQLNLRSWALSNGWNGSSAAQITLASGYYIYSSNTGVAALTIDGSWPGGLTFINNGYVMGMGGKGGGTRSNATVTGDVSSNVGLTAGGPAISMGVSCIIQNNTYIGGGGGGGGGVIAVSATGIYGNQSIQGGGGAGGGGGGDHYTGVSPGTLSVSGGAGGGIGGSGSNGVSVVPGANVYYPLATGGGGGRIMPGSRTGTPYATHTTGNAYGGYGGEGGVSGANQSISGTVNNGAGAGQTIAGYGGQAGGSGGAIAAGTVYAAATSAGGGGGGWGASGGSARVIVTVNNVSDVSSSGASGGKCVNLNGYSITWSATGTRWGGIS
jgi:hypothetical protein